MSGMRAASRDRPIARFGQELAGNLLGPRSPPCGDWSGSTELGDLPGIRRIYADDRVVIHGRNCRERCSGRRGMLLPLLSGPLRYVDDDVADG